MIIDFEKKIQTVEEGIDMIKKFLVENDMQIEGTLVVGDLEGGEVVVLNVNTDG